MVSLYIKRSISTTSSRASVRIIARRSKPQWPQMGNLTPTWKVNPLTKKLYRSVIGSLLYLTASRSNIMFSVCMCARYQANLKESHEKAIKRILRYLRYTPSFSLWYPKGAHFELLGYSDSDFAGCKIDQKAQRGDA